MSDKNLCYLLLCTAIALYVFLKGIWSKRAVDRALEKIFSDARKISIDPGP